MILNFKRSRRKPSEVLSSLPFPYIVTRDGVIVTGNSELNLESGKILNECLKNYDPGLTKQKVYFNDRHYIIYSNNYKTMGRENLTYLYFFEIPEEISETALVGIIFIDCYDEAISTMEEVRRPMIVARIDRLINDMVQKCEGIVTKFEKDKYIFVLSQNKLECLKEKKFDILSHIRELEMGNTVPVTLSMGIGINGSAINQCMEYARAALNLALGRGGDQVVINDNDNYIFYGGTAKEVGNNTRVRARVKAYVLSELISEAENVLVMGHKNADFDCIGASVGVHKIVESMEKKCSIILNTIPSSIKILHDNLIENQPLDKKIFMTSEEALKQIKPSTLLVVVDTHRPSMLEDVHLLHKFKKIVVFDHHRKSTESIQNSIMTYHEPYASSTCELVTEMLLYVKTKIKLKPLEADALLAGITVDTKSFSVKTGAKTFEAAAYLRRNGGDPVRVKTFFKNDLESYKAKSSTVANTEIIFDGIAVSICPSNAVNPIITTAQAADELLNISGIQASFVLCDIADIIYISARSTGTINVQVIMEKLGGGGHQTVAGAQLRSCSIDDAVHLTTEAVEKYLLEVKK